MGTYIGDVYVPNIGKISEPESGSIEVIKGLNIRRPLTVWHPSDLMSFDMEGILYTTGGKDAEDYADDLRALLRDPSYNFFDFAERKGFLALSAVPKLDRSAEKALVIPYSIDAMFHPDSQFTRQYKTSPKEYDNDWSITLGSDECENYVALPYGSSYSGGDNDSITRTGAEGSIAFVKATTNNDILFDVDDEYEVGECRVWDTSTADPSSGKRVYNIDHDFENDVAIGNSFIRLNLTNGVNFTHSWVYDGSQWKNIYWKMRFASVSGSSDYDLSFRKVSFEEISPDRIVAYGDVVHTDTKERIEFKIEMDRFNVRISKKSGSLASGWIQFHLHQYTDRRFLYEAVSDIVNDSLFDSTQFQRKEYIVQFNPTINYIMVCVTLDSGSTGFTVYPEGSPFEGAYIESIVSNSIHICNLPTDTSDLFFEAESMTLYDGAVADYTGSDASPKTGTTGVRLPVQNAKCEYPYESYPLGTYRMFARVKDTNQVTNDTELYCYNTTDNVGVHSDSQTASSSFGYLYTDVTLDSDDEGDNIVWGVRKATSDSNTIYVDYILLMPLVLDNGNGVKQIAHQSLVNQNLKRQLVLR